MSEQYSIVMSCLYTVKRGHIDPVNKVRLQIQLIHLLRLLGDTDMGDVNTRPACCSNSAFRTIFELAEQTSQSKHDPSLVNELMQRIGSIIASLSISSGKLVPSKFLVGSFQMD